jgi:hypothetical protein
MTGEHMLFTRGANFHAIFFPEIDDIKSSDASTNNESVARIAFLIQELNFNLNEVDYEYFTN